METLADELLLEILKYIDIQDRVKFSVMSKKFFNFYPSFISLSELYEKSTEENENVIYPYVKFDRDVQYFSEQDDKGKTKIEIDKNGIKFDKIKSVICEEVGENLNLLKEAEIVNPINFELAVRLNKNITYRILYINTNVNYSDNFISILDILDIKYKTLQLNIIEFNENYNTNINLIKNINNIKHLIIKGDLIIPFELPKGILKIDIYGKVQGNFNFEEQTFVDYKS